MGDDSFFPRKPVDQRRFAYVGLANDCNGERIVLLALLPIIRREFCKYLVQKIIDADSMFGGNRGDLIYAEFVVSHPEVAVFRLVHFVHGEDHRLFRLPEFFNHDSICRCWIISRIEDTDYEIRLAYSHEALASDMAAEIGLRIEIEAASIDDDELFPAPLPFRIMTVARDAGGIGDDRLAAAYKAVEEAGFPYVGPPDYCDNWKH